MLRHPEKEVVRHLGAIVEHRYAARRIERARANTRHELDVALSEGREERLGGLGRRGNGAREEHHECDLTTLADTSGREVLVKEQRRLAGCRRALEGRTANADDRVPLCEGRQQLGDALGTGD